MKKFQNTFLASLLVVACSMLMVSTPANAQSGSRLCGVGLGQLAIVIEMKGTGLSSKNRGRWDTFCETLYGEMKAGLAKKMDVSGAFEIIRDECEGVATRLSGGASSFDICDKMGRTGRGNGMNPYTVIYMGGQNVPNAIKAAAKKIMGPSFKSISTAGKFEITRAN
jgi:hypothetical protein